MKEMADFQVQHIHIPEGTSGKFSIKQMEYPSNHKFELANARTRIVGGDKSDSVSFDHSTTWIQLLENNRTWMTSLPIEQMQHWRVLKDFSGHVLVGGLGIGLAVTILSKNPKVKKITVVEQSPDVCELVYPYIRQNKVRLIKDDLFDFLKSLAKERDYNPVPNKFDFAFYDIWASDSQSTFFDTVVPLRELSKGLIDDSNVYCWNENVMRGQLFFSLHGRCTTAQMSPKNQTAKRALLNPTDKWTEWSRPFFEWFFGGYQLHENQIQNAMLYYSDIYGRIGWEEDWRNFISELD